MSGSLLRAGAVLSLIFSIGTVSSPAAPISFPQGYIPFTQLDYQTVPDANGYSLVVGEVKTDKAFGDLFHYLQSLPTLAGNQQYAGRLTQLAPGLSFSNVMVPTTSERSGGFTEFGGAIYDPLSYQPSSSPHPICNDLRHQPRHVLNVSVQHNTRKPAF